MVAAVKMAAAVQMQALALSRDSTYRINHCWREVNIKYRLNAENFSDFSC